MEGWLNREFYCNEYRSHTCTKTACADQHHDRPKAFGAFHRPGLRAELDGAVLDDLVDVDVDAFLNAKHQRGERKINDGADL